MSADVRQTETFCRICEPMCALVATVEDGRVTALAPDRGHPVSKGFACHKGLGFARVQNDPDRLLHPQARSSDGALARSSWEASLDAIGTTLRSLIDRHGPRSVAVYIGNPLAFNSAALLGTLGFAAALGTPMVFGAGSQDTTNKFAANQEMFGSYQLLVPDLYHTDHLLCLGANPRVSRWTAMSVAEPLEALRQLRARGATIRMVNPRHTETARWIGCETEQIRPDTDVYLLAAMLEVIRSEALYDATAIDEWGENVDALWSFIAKYPAARVAEVVGISAERITELAREFASAPSAAVYMATGVNQGSQGTLAYWLLTALSLVTGNIGRVGGSYYARGPIDTAAPAPTLAATEVETALGRFPAPYGYLPANLLADFITMADTPIRALLVLAGNPLLTTGGGDRLERALGSLDLLVVSDLFLSSIAEHAHHALPAASWLERQDINLISLGLQPFPFVRYAPAVVPARGEARNEAWMLAELGARLGLDGYAADTSGAGDAPIAHMLGLAGTDIAAIDALPHSTLAGPQPDRAGATRAAVLRPSGRIDCCPPAFMPAIERCKTIFADLAAAPPDTLRLISRRNDRSHNTNQLWRLKSIGPECGEAAEAFVHPDVAQRLGLIDGSSVRLTSAHGSVVAVLRLEAELRCDVVAFGHGSPRAAAGEAAVLLPRVNRLMPGGPGSVEPLSNMAHFSGVAVSIEAAPKTARWELEAVE